MKRANYQEQIYNDFKKKKEGSIFSNSDFYYITDARSVSKALFRLVEANKIQRLVNGLYCIPKYSSLINENVFPEPSDVAYKLADKFSWRIVPTGDTVLNQLGISTQVPSKYVYISDGPSRTYKYRSRDITFKHTTNRNISELPQSLSVVIQAIKCLGEDNVKDEHIKVFNNYLSDDIKRDLNQIAKNIPYWIYRILLKLEVE